VPAVRVKQPQVSALQISAVWAVLLLTTCPYTAALSTQAASTRCRADRAIVSLPDLPEASGVAASRRLPGRLWAINDSGHAVIFALDERGSVLSRIRLHGAKADDWEAIAVGPCTGGSCIYVGDIGDNNARRKQITIYSVPEAGDAKPATPISALHLVYPDGPQDAEALLATPDGGLYIVTKGSTGPIALYRLPRERQGPPVTLERVGKPRTDGKVAPDDRITDGAVSVDGATTVLRTHRALLFYRTARLTAGDWREERRVELESLGERQGEGVTFAPDGSLFLAGEGGGGKRPGTLLRVLCEAAR
jgi:hypothetical protein